MTKEECSIQQILERRDRVYGVDFSGAKDAGKKIWIAGGTIEGDTLRIDECRRADGLPGSGRSREQALAALREFIAGAEAGVFGLDFPLGLPHPLIGHNDWTAFVLAFPDDYPTPETFWQRCRERAGGRELKRVTDAESKTPFSAYNVRLYRQTYFGIRDVIHPLVRDRLACVLPMQRPQPDRPWLIEICPASTLKVHDLYLRRYKRGGAESHATRARILGGIERAGSLHIPSANLRSAVLDDRHGDALDGVIAAFATGKAVQNPAFPHVRSNEVYALEGYVYV